MCPLSGHWGSAPRRCPQGYSAGGLAGVLVGSHRTGGRRSNSAAGDNLGQSGRFFHNFQYPALVSVIQDTIVANEGNSSCIGLVGTMTGMLSISEALNNKGPGPVGYEGPRFGELLRPSLQTPQALDPGRIWLSLAKVPGRSLPKSSSVLVSQCPWTAQEAVSRSLEPLTAHPRRPPISFLAVPRNPGVKLRVPTREMQGPCTRGSCGVRSVHQSHRVVWLRSCGSSRVHLTLD